MGSKERKRCTMRQKVRKEVYYETEKKNSVLWDGKKERGVLWDGKKRKGSIHETKRTSMEANYGTKKEKVYYGMYRKYEGTQCGKEVYSYLQSLQKQVEL